MNWFSFTDRDIIGNVKKDYIRKVLVEYFNCRSINFVDLISICDTADPILYNIVHHYLLCLVTYLYTHEVYSLKKAIKNVFHITYIESKKIFLVENADNNKSFKITKDIIEAFNLVIINNNTEVIDDIIKEQHCVDTMKKITDEKRKIEKYQRMLNNANNNLKKLEDEYKNLTSNE